MADAARLRRMNEYKSIVHKLQNLEDFPDVLPVARELLISLLVAGVSLERYKSPKRSILAIRNFSETALDEFLSAERRDVLDEFEAYQERRAAGGQPELFGSFDEARAWLQQRTPVNLVDGAWLSHVHRVTTPFALRKITGSAWQTLAEELGDGLLEAHHVYIFDSLLRQVGIHVPDADTTDFLDPKHDLEHEQAWRSMTSQLLISIFPNDFLPEILGYNLHFESLSVSDLKAVRELPQFDISPFYYTLHISIDNADSGHSAMALANVSAFMAVVHDTGIMDVASAWKRIQAGYLMSQSMNDELTVCDYESRVADMLHRKAILAEKMHCASQARIGRLSLREWFSLAAGTVPVTGSGEDYNLWREKVIGELARSTPWVRRGASQKSRLVTELSWHGRMYGAFTAAETTLFCAWVDSLAEEGHDATQTYEGWAGGLVSVQKSFSPPRHDAAVSHPAFSSPPVLPILSASHHHEFVPNPLLLPVKGFRLDALLVLWFVHPCLLENSLTSPFRTAKGLGHFVVQLLRFEMGYGTVAAEEQASRHAGVTGMDAQQPQDDDCRQDLVSLGLHIARRQGVPEPSCLGDILGPPGSTTSRVDQFAHALLSWSMRPQKNQALLLGLARSFVDVEIWVATNNDLLAKRERNALQAIVQGKLAVLDACVRELESSPDMLSEFVGGYTYGRSELDAVLF
ncbi:hypothetical protein CC79DRAFT_1287768 [Sarocladium strictum]